MSKSFKNKRKQLRLKRKSKNFMKPDQPSVRPEPVDPSSLQYKWTFARTFGPGLVNMFNTCFLNAVLCCLVYTAPLTQHLLAGEHTKICTVKGFCGLCAMNEHAKKCFATAKSMLRNAAISPNYFTTNLKKISSTLTLGRQEDAHEFFMFLLGSFTNSYTPCDRKLTETEEDAGLVHLLFGGKLRSRVTCTKCGATSDSFDRYSDLSIDIKGHSKLKNALYKFVDTDTIGADNTEDNGYKCSSCRNTVVATKKMTVDELPKNLVIHLKRFAFDLERCAMRKVHQHVNFPAKIDMAPFVSKERRIQAATYKLYAVLVHDGHSCDSGHYYAYVRTPSGNWTMINDDIVSQVSEQEVLSQKAYMLFYEQKNVSFTSGKSEKSTTTASTAVPTSPIASTSPIISLPALSATSSTSSSPISQPCSPTISTKLAFASSLPVSQPLRSCLKRKREETEEPAPPTKKVLFEEDCVVLATDPESWIVRPSALPHRSLLGNQSPRTFSNAVGHDSQWIVRDL
ncbi:hypothetical protein BY458DRAFT_454752 [Sporodiniella umbellata]|nr:hypothetical protein BY458DRAFT_454752 [Sporodiniella umbellata]